MRHLSEHLVPTAIFDNASGVHDADMIRHLIDDTHVVRDDKDRHSCFLLQIGNQPQNLCLDGDIEGGGRFVGDEQFRFAGQCHGNHHALFHTTGQLVRKIVNALVRIGDPNVVEQLDSAFSRGPLADFSVLA